MTAKNNIPAGYKDSAVGIIPQEWKVDRLGEICLTFKSGTTITSQSIKESGLYPVYGGNGLRGYTDSYTHNGDYILIGRQGALCGNINFIRGKAYISEHAIAVQPNESNSIEFLRYKLDFWNLNRFSESSAQPGLSVEKLVRYKLAVPPMEEQRKIAEILGVWDEAIEKQSRLIEKLELRKRALMQRLLTGRTRLPGFTTPWQKRRMKDCFEHITDTSNGCEYLPMTISARLGLISQKDKFDRVIAGDSLKKYTHIQKGDFAYNKGNSNLYEMGCIYRLKEQDAVVPFVYICFRPKQNVIGEFYQHFFINHGLDRQLKRIITSGARGDGLLNVDKTDFFELEIVYPPIAEQKTIAEVLTAADNEIAIHRKRLEALRLQKRGLMQQLLTGKTRVKI